MSSTYGHRGNFIKVLSKIVTDNPEIPLGYILAEGIRGVTKKSGISYVHSDDETFYTVFENMDMPEIMSDEKMSDDEFLAWAQERGFEEIR